MPGTWIPPSAETKACTARQTAARSALSRHGLLHENGWLVRTWSPTCRHRDVQQTQIDAELAAMLIPVAEHDVAQELRPRLGQHFTSSRDHAPGFLHAGVITIRKRRAHRC